MIAVSPVSPIHPLRMMRRQPEPDPKAYRVKLTRGRTDVHFDANSDVGAINYVARQYGITNPDNDIEWRAAGIVAIYKNPDTQIWPKSTH